MRVRARKRFFLSGRGNVGPGLIDVPDERVGKLVSRKLIEAPTREGVPEAEREAAAISHLGVALGLEREPEESRADFLERLAGEAEALGAREPDADAGGDLESHTVVELREMARERGDVEGFSTMKKAELVKALS